MRKRITNLELTKVLPLIRRGVREYAQIITHDMPSALKLDIEMNARRCLEVELKQHGYVITTYFNYFSDCAIFWDGTRKEWRVNYRRLAQCVNATREAYLARW